MKKITKIEITTLVLALVAFSLYYIPNFNQKQEVMKAAKIKTTTEAFTQRVLDEFAKNKNAKATDVAKKITDEFNQTAQAEGNKSIQEFTFEKECKNCNTIETDDSLQMVILTSFDKKGDLITRTVIKPPSFVTYTSREN